MTDSISQDRDPRLCLWVIRTAYVFFLALINAYIFCMLPFPSTAPQVMELLCSWAVCQASRFYPAALEILLKILDQGTWASQHGRGPGARHQKGDMEQLSGDTDQKMSGEHTEQSLIVRMK